MVVIVKDQKQAFPSSLLPSSSSRAGCPSPATRPVRALRCEPAASSAGQPLARGVRAAPRHGQQRARWQQGGLGWADAVGGKGGLIFLSTGEGLLTYALTKGQEFARVRKKRLRPER